MGTKVRTYWAVYHYVHFAEYGIRFCHRSCALASHGLWFQLVVIGLSSILWRGFKSNNRERWLVAPVIFMPLMYQWVYFVRPIVRVGHRIHSYRMLLTTFLNPSSVHSTCQYGSRPTGMKLPGLYDLYSSVFCDSRVLVSLVIMSYHQVWKILKNNGNSL